MTAEIAAIAGVLETKGMYLFIKARLHFAVYADGADATNDMGAHLDGKGARGTRSIYSTPYTTQGAQLKSIATYWMGATALARACKHNVAQPSLFWVRDVFWPQHPKCWDPISKHISNPDCACNPF